MSKLLLRFAVASSELNRNEINRNNTSQNDSHDNRPFSNSKKNLFEFSNADNSDRSSNATQSSFPYENINISLDPDFFVEELKGLGFFGYCVLNCVYHK